MLGIYIEFSDREEAEEFLSLLDGVLSEDFYERTKRAVEEMLRHTPDEES